MARKRYKIETLKEGDKIRWFSYPHPDPNKWWYRQSWHNGTVKTVSPCGKFAVINANVSWGKNHDIRVRIADMEIATR